MSTGYESLRRLIHESLIPGLERCSVLVIRLRGLARFQESSNALGLFAPDLEQIFDTLNCLQLLAHEALISAGVELRQFGAFAHWIRQEIENQSTDPLSLAASEAAEKDIVFDYPQILEYVQGAMLRSDFFDLFDLLPPGDKRPASEIHDDSGSIYPRYKKQVKARKDASSGKHRLSGLAALLSRLERQCQVVSGKIAETQKRKVRFGDLVQLMEGECACFDARMLSTVRILREHQETRYSKLQDQSGEASENSTSVLGIAKNDVSPDGTSFPAMWTLAMGLTLNSSNFQNLSQGCEWHQRHSEQRTGGNTVSGWIEVH